MNSSRNYETAAQRNTLMGPMMIFIPLNSGANVSTDYRAKILFNHDKFNREEDAACKGGLQDLNQKK